MTRGFYEQLGVPVDADLDTIKASYGRAVAHLLKRREATLAQGGDTSALDLAREQLDEAWEILSDPTRRRRYDAMLAVAGDGLTDTDVDGLWSRVAGAMIHPAVAAAARIVDACTTLKLGPLPVPPRPAPGQAGTTSMEEAPTTPTRVLGGDFGSPRPVTSPGADVVPLHASGSPALRVVRDRPEPGEVVEMATPPPTTPTAPTVAPPTSPGTSPGSSPGISVPTATGDIDQLVDQLGYTGELLRTIREQAGLSLEDMSASTRISVRCLQAVEAEDYEALPPAAAFVRGYVREEARVLGLDMDRVVAGYMRRFTDDV